MDMTTTYMTLRLANPLIVSANPLSRDVDNIRRMEDFGASAVVLSSLFEEQIRNDSSALTHYMEYGAERFAESLSYFPRLRGNTFVPEEYLDHIARAKRAVKIPIIASINCITSEGWTEYPRLIQQAGADGLEINVYYIPTEPLLSGDQVEKVYLTVLRTVKNNVTMPVSMKVSPFFSSPANMLTQLDKTGADALVLFNRFYQPDIDVDNMTVFPNVKLSSSSANRLPMRWIAIMHGRIQASLAATGGIHTGLDAAKMILAGADAVMLCSVLLRNGIEHLKVIAEELRQIMDKKGWSGPGDMRGRLSLRNCPDPTAFERANYMKALMRYGRTATLE